MFFLLVSPVMLIPAVVVMWFRLVFEATVFGPRYDLWALALGLAGIVTMIWMSKVLWKGR